MDLVIGAMGSLLPKMLKLLGDEYKLQTGMKKKVKLISQELESTHAFLRMVSDVPWYQLDDVTKAWAREAREVSFEMEDVLDTFLVRLQEGEPPRTNTSRLERAMKNMVNLFCMGKARRDISCAIQDIKNRLQELKDQRARYRIDDIVVHQAATTISTVDPRLHAMYKEVTNLEGISIPRDQLMMSMQSEEVLHKKKIIAIVGIGGLGKTTLAKAVYEKTRSDFKCGAFVPVGRNPNLSKVLMDILYELDKERFADIHIKNRDEKQLIDNLRDFLTGKRYFIIIDDLWEEKSWIEAIELALLENNCGSRIIITTRNTDVANKIGGQVYKMPPLSDETSRKLFYTRIFGDEEKWPHNEPDEVSKKILKKCDGVPLAIITMASLLAGKSRDRWSDLFTSVGFVHKNDKQVENTMKILSFSYYDMPAYLRTCLLYLSVFPEDNIIEKEELIWRWIAEGLIQGKPGIRSFELGEQYFNDLVNRSMIQAIEHKWSGTVEFRIHDMVLDLIRSISIEENFVTILANDEGTSPSPLRSARRIAIHDNSMDHIALDNAVDIPKVRSFVAIRCALGSSIPFSSCIFLRVLHLEYCSSVRQSHLIHLGNLLHLRYLGLKNCQEIDGLPSEIAGLKYLNTLIVEGTDAEIQLSPIFSRLTQLVCLRGEFIHGPKWIGNLTSLQELQVAIYMHSGSSSKAGWDEMNSSADDCSMEDHIRGFLKELGSLRELRVLNCAAKEMDESMQKDLLMSLRNLHKLQKLILDWRSYEFQEIADQILWQQNDDFVFPQHLRVLTLSFFKFEFLPPCIGAAYLPSLTNLSLDVSFMEQEDLEFLGKLPELRYLELNTECMVTISNINASNVYFRKLRGFEIPSSMVQFRCNEGDSSISFHIWDTHENDDFLFISCCKSDCSLASYAVMPSLERLCCRIPVRFLKDSNVECGKILGLGHLPSLLSVHGSLDMEDASAEEMAEAKASMRKATEEHPNRPDLFCC